MNGKYEIIGLEKLDDFLAHFSKKHETEVTDGDGQTIYKGDVAHCMKCVKAYCENNECSIYDIPSWFVFYNSELFIMLDLYK